MFSNRKLISLALPIMADSLLALLAGLVDAAMVSSVGEAAVSAISVVDAIAILVVVVFSSLATGGVVVTAQYIGSGNTKAAKTSANQLIYSCAASALVVSLLVMCFIPQLLRLVYGKLDETVFTFAKTYFFYILLGMPFFAVSSSCCALLRAMSRSGTAMVLAAGANIMNVIGNAVLIFGFDMGVAGAAVATVAGQVVSMSLGLYFNRKYNPEVQVRFRKLSPDFRMMWQITRIGFPSVLMMAIGSVMTFCMNKILILYTVGKETAATVFGVYFKLNSFIFMPIFGLNNGVVPIVAYNYGAQNRRRMMEAIKFSVTISVSIMTFGMIIFELAPHLLLSIFEASDNMMSIGIPALRIIATTFPIAGGTIILGTVFQALGKSMYSMLTSFMRQLVALVPSAYVLARIGMVNGNQDLVWWSYPIAEVVSLAATMVCFGMIYRDIIKPIPEEGEKLA